MIKKIVLLNPPSVAKESWIEEIVCFPPLGLAYLAAVLERSGYEVKIIDCLIEGIDSRQKMNDQLVRVGMSDDEIVEALVRSEPDLVGVSVAYSCQLHSAVHVNSLIKGIDRNIITVAGGNHVTAAPKSIGNNTFDWIVFGEGEYRLLNLVEAINSSDTRKLVPGTICASDAAHSDYANTRIKFIQDLDSIPFPQYRSLPLEKYWRARGGSRFFTMITTRGCPFNCVFCSVHNVMGRKIRYRSVENVLNEVAFLKQEFNVEQLYFEDDNFTFNINRAKEILGGIIQKDFGVEIIFRNGIRADRVDPELLKLMKRAGVKDVRFSPESGSQETLDRIIKKNLKLEDCEKAVRMAKDAGIKVTCFLVIGFPEETMQDIMQTVQYGHKLKKLGADFIWVSCATPYPGTELLVNCIKKGILDEESLDYQSLTYMDAVIHNEWFTSEEVKSIRDQAVRDFSRRTLKDLFLRGTMLLLSHPVVFMREIYKRLKRGLKSFMRKY